jgi:hypothetical protein
VLRFSCSWCWKMFEISGSYLPLIILYTSIMSPLDLLYDNDGSFRRRKRSSYDKLESPGISFVALLCIFSIMSMCFLRYGFQTAVFEIRILNLLARKLQN